MSLEFKLEGDILEVIETVTTFHHTKKFSWFYRVSDWTYREQDQTEFQPMSEGQRAWVEKYYLPKVGLFVNEQWEVTVNGRKARVINTKKELKDIK